jgi:hypothetical protein
MSRSAGGETALSSPAPINRASICFRVAQRLGYPAVVAPTSARWWALSIFDLVGLKVLDQDGLKNQGHGGERRRHSCPNPKMIRFFTGMTPGEPAGPPRIRNWQGFCDLLLKIRGARAVAASPDHFGACHETPASF